MKTKRTPKKKRPPIKVVSAFGPITPEMIAALPEDLRRALAELIFGDFTQVAEEAREEREAIRVAA